MTITHKHVDVVTIGAGWTATMLAAKLCPAGTEMVSLEQGAAEWTWPHFSHDHDSLRYSVRYALMVNLRDETWTWRPIPRSPALPTGIASSSCSRTAIVRRTGRSSPISSRSTSLITRCSRRAG